MTSVVGRQTPGRDLRLDFFRGLALFCIFIDHIPGNRLSQFTLQAIGTSDAAEVFILISGYTAGRVYGGVLDRMGFIRCTARVYRRVWQLYVAHVFLFVLYMALVAHFMGSLVNPLYTEELRAADFLKEPGVAIFQSLTLTFQPSFMDILPLYIALMGVLPLALLGLARARFATLAVCLLLYLATWRFGWISLPTYPGPETTWFFNPFGWQLLFCLAADLGYRGLHGGNPWVRHRALFVAAIAVALLGFAIHTTWTIHETRPEVSALFFKFIGPFMDKSNLSPIRLINVLALAALVVHLIAPNADWLASRWAAPFLSCGRNSLHVFCLGILLSLLGHLVLTEYYGGFALHLAVSAVGIALMIGFAWVLDWNRTADARPPQRPPVTAPADGER